MLFKRLTQYLCDKKCEMKIRKIVRSNFPKEERMV